MPATTTVTIHDETLSGERSEALTLDFLTERITVRELIRSRVYQEVQDHNRKKPETFRGLVQPTEAERTLNGTEYKLRDRRKDVDWKQQFARACDAFARNGFFVLVDERQVESLDEEIVLRADTRVSFVKLVPLVGG
jgi:hypothetical protein